MKKILSILLILSSLAVARAQTPLVFSLLQFTGSTNDTTITILPVSNPVIYNGSFYWFPPGGTNIQTTNGLGFVTLIPGQYTASIAGLPQSWSLNVTNAASLVNAANLSSGVTYYSGVQNLTAGANVTITQPNPGNYIVSSAGGGGSGGANLTNSATAFLATNAAGAISLNVYTNLYDLAGTGAAALTSAEVFASSLTNNLLAAILANFTASESFASGLTNALLAATAGNLTTAEAYASSVVTNIQVTVTVSPAGIATGQSAIPNAGSMFGPDTPGTTSGGLQEAVNYLNTTTTNIYGPAGGKIIIGRGTVITTTQVSFTATNCTYVLEGQGLSASGILYMGATTNGLTNDAVLWFSNQRQGGSYPQIFIRDLFISSTNDLLALLVGVQSYGKLGMEDCWLGYYPFMAAGVIGFEPPSDGTTSAKYLVGLYLEGQSASDIAWVNNCDFSGLACGALNAADHSAFANNMFLFVGNNSHLPNNGSAGSISGPTNNLSAMLSLASLGVAIVQGHSVHKDCVYHDNYFYGGNFAYAEDDAVAEAIAGKPLSEGDGFESEAGAIYISPVSPFTFVNGHGSAGNLLNTAASCMAINSAYGSGGSGAPYSVSGYATNVMVALLNQASAVLSGFASISLPPISATGTNIEGVTNGAALIGVPVGSLVGASVVTNTQLGVSLTGNYEVSNNLSVSYLPFFANAGFGQLTTNYIASSSRNGTGFSFLDFTLTHPQSLTASNVASVNLIGCANNATNTVALTYNAGPMMTTNPVSGVVEPTYNGGALTNLNASQLTGGAVPLAALPPLVLTNIVYTNTTTVTVAGNTAFAGTNNFGSLGAGFSGIVNTNLLIEGTGGAVNAEITTNGNLSLTNNLAVTGTITVAGGISSGGYPTFGYNKSTVGGNVATFYTYLSGYGLNIQSENGAGGIMGFGNPAVEIGNNSTYYLSISNNSIVLLNGAYFSGAVSFQGAIQTGTVTATNGLTVPQVATLIQFYTNIPAVTTAVTNWVLETCTNGLPYLCATNVTSGGYLFQKFSSITTSP